MAQSAAYNLDVYQARNPKASSYYKCVGNHFEKCFPPAMGFQYSQTDAFWRAAVFLRRLSLWQ